MNSQRLFELLRLTRRRYVAMQAGTLVAVIGCAILAFTATRALATTYYTFLAIAGIGVIVAYWRIWSRGRPLEGRRANGRGDRHAPG